MFGGGGFWGSPIGDPDGHLTKERAPPKRPITLEFPDYVPPTGSHKLDYQQSSLLRDRICHVRTFAEINEDDINNFNIHLQQDVDLQALVPDSRFSSRPLPFDEDLKAMLAEVSISNEDAFREVLRMEPLPGRKKPRLAYARNFFGNLEDMARYWDSSTDHYYLVPRSGEDQAKYTTLVESTETTTATNMTANRPGPSLHEEVNGDMKEVYKGYRLGNGEDLPSGTRVAMVKNFIKIVMHKFHCRDHEPMPSPREKFSIRGVNVQSIQYNCCVARIPQDIKLARSRMLEGPLMGIHIREDLRFQNRISHEEDKPITKRDSTRAESPDTNKSHDAVANKMSVRHITKGPPFVGEKFDLLREVGAMLILARQREREGKSKATISGNDKWWVSQHRWGGGPVRWGQLAHEQYEDEDPSWSSAERVLQDDRRRVEEDFKNSGSSSREAPKPESMSVDDLLASNAPSIAPVPGDPIAGPRKKKLRSLTKPPDKADEMRDGRRLMYVPPFKKKWYLDWQKLRCNTPMWDDKLIYKHIGRRQDSQFDDIYLLNGVNHHIGITHMKVHPDYLKWLEEGLPVDDEEIEGGLKRNVIHVRRSKWYSMFDVEARCEMLVALWKIMCWLNRDHIDPSEEETVGQK